MKQGVDRQDSFDTVMPLFYFRFSLKAAAVKQYLSSPNFFDVGKVTNFKKAKKKKMSWDVTLSLC